MARSLIDVSRAKVAWECQHTSSRLARQQSVMNRNFSRERSGRSARIAACMRAWVTGNHLWPKGVHPPCGSPGKRLHSRGGSNPPRRSIWPPATSPRRGHQVFACGNVHGAERPRCRWYDLCGATVRCGDNSSPGAAKPTWRVGAGGCICRFAQGLADRRR